MPIRCIIVDDEAPAIDELTYILSDIRDLDIVGTANSYRQAIKCIRTHTPDLVFLDIKMPGKDGFEVANSFTNPGLPPFFVFATAFDQHAVRAFDSNAIDYILKPFQPDRVYDSVDRARHLLELHRQEGLERQMDRFMNQLRPSAKSFNKISVDHKGRILLLDPADIIFCKAENKGVRVHTRQRDYEIYGISSLDELEKRLQHQAFFRAHRGYLVNLKQVKEVAPWFNGRYVLTMAQKKNAEIPVSRGRVRSLKQRLGL